MHLRHRRGSRAAVQPSRFDTNYYSVPYNLVHELVEVRSTPTTTIEIFRKSQRLASHLRAHDHGHAVTIAEHRATVPPGASMGYRGCLGIIRLA